MSDVICLPGAEAFSGFRKAQRLSALQRASSRVKSLEAQFVYLIAFDAQASSSVLLDTPSFVEPLSQLLDLTGLSLPPTPRDTSIVWVFPRQGTRSPWSSKAIEILRHCGLHTVTRVERGVCYRVRGVKSDDSQLPTVALALHDRMTESVFFGAPPLDLFAPVAPKPLATIGLGATEGSAHTALTAANQQLGLALSVDEIA